jgi:hypothetical protein
MNWKQFLKPDKRKIILTAFGIIIFMIIIAEVLFSFFIPGIKESITIADGTSLTVDSVNASNKVVLTYIDINWSRTYRSEAGYKFVVVHINLQNNVSRGVTSLSLGDWKIKTDSGKVYEQTTPTDIIETYNYENSTNEDISNYYCDYFIFFPSDIGSVKGCINFEIPENENPSEFIFRLSGSGAGAVKIFTVKI